MQMVYKPLIFNSVDELMFSLEKKQNMVGVD